ncbi:hypothetical protein PENARI_c001G11437 [Penicillium arizonense]|uniref:Uncharacterized protein n=1 Tax=Penicillium arizonense TaxID=1835702 RepID=A0A1F5LXG9_PENAI|nr:hypothetical protein PENARI_c001G11437 [Penicillium arizonense]OGE57726.1 hypothetical protein PENARI_c001G11437 [Penicillium arizonense]
MANTPTEASSLRDAVPPPPPPPENPQSKISPSVLKMRTIAPESVLFTPSPKSQGPAPAGLYFFYGTLQHPTLPEEHPRSRRGASPPPRLSSRLQMQALGFIPRPLTWKATGHGAGICL